MTYIYKSINTSINIQELTVAPCFKKLVYINILIVPMARKDLFERATAQNGTYKKEINNEIW